MEKGSRDIMVQTAEAKGAKGQAEGQRRRKMEPYARGVCNFEYKKKE